MHDEDTSMGSQDDKHLIDKIYERTASGDIDINEIMVNDTHARLFQDVDTTYISKIWRIDLDNFNRILDVTTQTIVRSQNTKLSRNYGTNKCMIHFKRIQEYFFMDNLFCDQEVRQVHNKPHLFPTVCD